MLRLKMAGTNLGIQRMAIHALSGIVLAGSLLAGTAIAQTKLGPAAPVSYDNRYEVYGGINFMNFQAGQNLPKRMNFAGGEALGTYWLTRRLGVAVDYRGEAGTTPVLPNPFVNNRPLVYMNMLMGGVQYRGPKNHYAAIDYHGYFGASHGVFNYSTMSVPAGSVATTGLYTNRTKPIGAVGASVDFNRSKAIAVRISPDLIFEHFGTETREFFAISGGLIYRFGKR
ncbi:hypothetical protein [Granulicella arctica]|uniref:hypothetical protein n=1 Tax=Granulicella arctica TaxID=940613 RepID=UPI0021E078F0|nr:hypothetical protein [Granulicella arctica]